MISGTTLYVAEVFGCIDEEECAPSLIGPAIATLGIAALISGVFAHAHFAKRWRERTRERTRALSVAPLRLRTERRARRVRAAPGRARPASAL